MGAEAFTLPSPPVTSIRFLPQAKASSTSCTAFYVQVNVPHLVPGTLDEGQLSKQMPRQTLTITVTATLVPVGITVNDVGRTQVAGARFLVTDRHLDISSYHSYCS